MPHKNQPEFLHGHPNNTKEQPFKGAEVKGSFRNQVNTGNSSRTFNPGEFQGDVGYGIRFKEQPYRGSPSDTPQKIQNSEDEKEHWPQHHSHTMGNHCTMGGE